MYFRILFYFTEMKEKPKAEEPEIPAIPNVPQEIHPENEIYSCFVLTMCNHHSCPTKFTF